MILKLVILIKVFSFPKLVLIYRIQAKYQIVYTISIEIVTYRKIIVKIEFMN
ncbi:hypothetical protein MYP_1184 [Sporocytophaga myxococcoides]|uniref:Uncharacterized protein n=1 Tax=Sporocytophaga myxococcoides TaxID=153721 RepID=A0A098LAI6_9BACT|nr:hypothetical protein MYP_1184 [Sporocytophaga myxococcoides]